MQSVIFLEAVRLAEEGRISVNVFIQIVTKQNRDVIGWFSLRVLIVAHKYVCLMVMVEYTGEAHL